MTRQKWNSLSRINRQLSSFWIGKEESWLVILEKKMSATVRKRKLYFGTKEEVRKDVKYYLKGKNWKLVDIIKPEEYEKWKIKKSKERFI